MEPKMVLPGDEIAVAEEFEPGEGTYERNGLVFAANTRPFRSYVPSPGSNSSATAISSPGRTIFGSIRSVHPFVPGEQGTRSEERRVGRERRGRCGREGSRAA